jgi:membrane associated rhomboid family serine protease
MRQRTKVVQGVGQPSGFARSPATYVLIAINVLVYLVEIAGGPGGLDSPSGKVIFDYGLFGPFVGEGEVYRLVTSGFLHANFFPHLAFNMLLLFFLGRLLEPALGTVRYVVLYFAALLAGSLGVMILQPDALSLGASGAIFGLAGAVFVIARGRGLDAIAGQVGFLIVFNLIFSFTSAHISIGAHIGGLVGGAVCALGVVAGERGMFGRHHRAAELIVMGLVAAVSVLGAVALA